MSMPAQIVMQRCDVLATFSEDSNETTRLYLTSPVREVHDSMRLWMSDAGMTVRVDAVGNIIGRRQADVSGERKILLLGSHLDTVPNAGKYDGIVGVLIALAVVDQLRADRLPFDIDVIGFSEEEGVRFALPFIGCKAVVGDFDSAWLRRTDANGVTLEEAIRRFGLDPAEIEQATYPLNKSSATSNRISNKVRFLKTAAYRSELSTRLSAKVVWSYAFPASPGMPERFRWNCGTMRWWGLHRS